MNSGGKGLFRTDRPGVPSLQAPLPQDGSLVRTFLLKGLRNLSHAACPSDQGADLGLFGFKPRGLAWKA